MNWHWHTSATIHGDQLNAGNIAQLDLISINIFISILNQMLK